MGAFTLCFQGCKRDEASAEPPPHSPESYMNDPAFRKQLSDKRLEVQALVTTRARLVKRMEEIAASNGIDRATLAQAAASNATARATLEKIPEWNELYSKVSDLNAKIGETRQRQLRIFADRVTPAGAAQKAPVKPVTAEDVKMKISK